MKTPRYENSALFQGQTMTHIALVPTEVACWDCGRFIRLTSQTPSEVRGELCDSCKSEAK